MCVGCPATLSLAGIQVGQKLGILGTSHIDDRLVNTLGISLLSIQLHREFNGRCGESIIDRIHIWKSASSAGSKEIPMDPAPGLFDH